MDPDFEPTYTMYCGGGGDSDSGGNDSGVSDTGDTGSEADNNAATDSGAASVGAGDSGVSDTGDTGSESGNVESTQQGAASVGAGPDPNTPTDTGDLESLSENVEANLSASGISDLGSGDTGPGGGTTETGVSATGDSSDVDITDGITYYTETKAEALEAANKAATLERSVGIGSNRFGTTFFSIMTGLPINTMVHMNRVMENYNARRGNAPATAAGETASSPSRTGGVVTGGLLGSDGDGDGDNQQVVYETKTPLYDAANSAAIRFLTNTKALNTQERYALAKAKVQGILNPPTIDVESSPYYNYLKQFGLNKGIL